jgi:hypothetical protein
MVSGEPNTFSALGSRITPFPAQFESTESRSFLARGGRSLHAVIDPGAFIVVPFPPPMGRAPT